MTGSEPVELRIDDGVARIILNDPGNRNAVTARSAEAFARAARQAAIDPTVRVILLTGTGAFFSVGGDIGEFLSNEADLSGHLAVLTDYIHAGVRHLVHARAPVVVGLNGIAAGGGVGIMLSGDFIIAKESAKINSGYTRSGLTPDAGLSWFLPRLVGHVRAFEIIAFNEFLSARQALDLGVLSRVVADGEFEAELEAAVGRLKAMPGNVLGDAKRLLRHAADVTIDVQLEAEAESIAARVRTPETRAILNGFLKR
jgi:2-(1,2-epoxy-1,2-dihydrophenyl)acetyl-CoA isomerase